MCLGTSQHVRTSLPQAGEKLQKVSEAVAPLDGLPEQPVPAGKSNNYHEATKDPMYQQHPTSTNEYHHVDTWELLLQQKNFTRRLPAATEQRLLAIIRRAVHFTDMVVSSVHCCVLQAAPHCLSDLSCTNQCICVEATTASAFLEVASAVISFVHFWSIACWMCMQCLSHRALYVY